MLDRLSVDDGVKFTIDHLHFGDLRYLMIWKDSKFDVFATSRLGKDKREESQIS